MVVLAMNIRGNHPADGDKFRTWHDRREISAWQKGRNDIGQQNAGLNGEASRLGVEPTHSVEATEADRRDHAEGGITVRFTASASDITGKRGLQTF
jgi:hypothetical protein